MPVKALSLMEPSNFQIIVNEIFGPQTQKPNKFTVGMGELIQQAREELGYSQAALAAKIDMRRATLAQIEKGKSEPSATHLIYLSVALDKPIPYFFPPYAMRKIAKDELSSLELEALDALRDMGDDEVRDIAVRQLKVMAEFQPMEILAKYLEEAEIEHEALKEIRSRRKKG